MFSYNDNVMRECYILRLNSHKIYDTKKAQRLAIDQYLLHQRRGSPPTASSTTYIHS